MGDEKLLLFNQFLFSVKMQENEFETNNMDLASPTTPSNLWDAVPESIKKEVLTRCRLSLSGHTDNRIIYTDINDRPYIITLVYRHEHTFTFLAVADVTPNSDCQTSHSQLEFFNKPLTNCDNMLSRQIKFEEFFARLAREFLNAGLSGFYKCVEELVSGLGDLLNTDFVFASKSDNTAGRIFGGHLFVNGKIDYAKLRHIMTISEFDNWFNQFRSGRIFMVNDVQKETPELFDTLKRMDNNDLRSFIAVPVLRSDEFFGMLCVASFRQKRIWTTFEVSLLKSAADIIISAYLRTKMEKQLSESNRVLVEFEECLQDMLSVQESLAAVTKQFLIAEPKCFGSCVGDMLETLSELTDTDQACISVIESKPCQVYTWNKKGLPFLRDLLSNNTKTTANWIEYLSRTDYIAINDVTEDINNLPAFLQDLIIRSGIKSLLIVPIRSQDTIIAILFLGKILRSCRWSNAYIETAKQFLDVFMCAFLNMRKHSHYLLANQANSRAAKEALTQASLFMKANKYAQALIDATAENLSSVFCMICKEFSSLLPIESVNLTRYSLNNAKTCIVFNWHSTNPFSKCAICMSERNENKVLSIPVLYQNIVWGSLIVGLCPHAAAEDSHDTLEILAECFVRAYMRVYPNSNTCVENAKQAKLCLQPALP